MNDLFNFLISWYFDNLFNDFLDGDNLRDFDNSFDNFFNNLFHFNDFRHNSEDLEDVINADDAHNLLIDHTNDSLINLEGNACSKSDLFELFKKGLDQNSQMKFDSSGLFTAV